MSAELALQVMTAFLDAADRGELSIEDTVAAWRLREAFNAIRDFDFGLPD